MVPPDRFCGSIVIQVGRPIPGVSYSIFPEPLSLPLLLIVFLTLPPPVSLLIFFENILEYPIDGAQDFLTLY